MASLALASLMLSEDAIAENFMFFGFLLFFHDQGFATGARTDTLTRLNASAPASLRVVNDLEEEAIAA